MSADFSTDGGVSPHHSPRGGSSFPYQGQDQQSRNQTPRSMVQGGLKSASPSAMLAHGLPTPAPETGMNAWQTQDFGPASDVPGIQSPSGQYAVVETPPYLRTKANRHFDQTPNPHSRSPNVYGHDASHSEILANQNDELMNEIEVLRISRDETQEACDNMLTELITTQEALAIRDAEIQALREQVSCQYAERQVSLSRNDERELRDLRRRCNRLQGELRQKDEQLRQIHTQTGMHSAMYGRNDRDASDHGQDDRKLSETQQRYIDAENRANHAEHMRQRAQQRADTYEQQLRDWSAAYDGLKASYEELQHARSEAIDTKRSDAGEKAAQQQLVALKAAMDDVKKERDFYKNNSENVAKKNSEVKNLLRELQDELQTKTRQFEQQRSMLEQFQIQVR